VYRKGVREDHPLPFAQISDVLEQPDTLVWVDANSPDQSEAAQLGEEFGLHRLALADALSDHQRPKMERYQGYVFVIAYAAAIGEAGRVDMQEVAIFVAPGSSSRSATATCSRSKPCASGSTSARRCSREVVPRSPTRCWTS
jgi:magnesium transporter